jgi:proteasome accessory factor A
MASTADRDESATAGSELAARQNTRVMGIETEYGISALTPASPALPGGFGNAFIEDDLHPMQLSNHVVKAYGASAPGQPAGWDYETETPLRDIRGYEI